ncbi:hypothetical protein EJ02DRAFT_181254 [Clathrospora elynae]|uniref:DUF8004 domain-containing protein n=1 Tax=Clathrospora elynae TaxID=706981 RepID=A0A6A5SR77_9PLEO|nr:hypothetical protein EJ02DRAFT_181254 [Clathrospora elynae]
MASEMKLPESSGVRCNIHQPPIPSRSSSVSRNHPTGNPRSLSQPLSAASLSGVPLPQPIVTSTTARHSFCDNDPHSSITLKDDTKRVCIYPARARRPSASCTVTIRNAMHPQIQRWSGLTRTVSDWDHGLRRDPELWYEDGDCYVHLHAKGVSRRGPSFRIPFRVLRQKKCNAMLSQYDAQLSSAPGSSSQQLRRMPSSLTNANREPSTAELFIPAPEETSRDDAFRWHITTRNFFAFLLGKPLVGEHMGQAFVDLQERLHIFRPTHNNNHKEFLDYAENQGYRDLSECTDYALASLFYAEHYKLRDVWIDAFAHCVGMNDSLVLSPEFAMTSRLTKALITRARLNVDFHLSQVSTALSKFLEDDLSPTYLGLTDGARSHLNRTRRFLHSFYTEKFGYWPPPRGTTFPKALYKSMYYDFRSLYEYLVDNESTNDISSQKPASGGICVLQNVGIFDKRHNFKPQPHPLPLLPIKASSPKRTGSQRALRQLTLGSQNNKTHQLHTMSALAVAANTFDKEVTSSKIVQAYIHFEKAMKASQREETIPAIDARKVNWLLIYGTLQYLVSALRAPEEVRDTESPEYPLCYAAEQTSSRTSSRETTPLATPSINVPQAIDDYLAESQSNPYAIQPDCHREDYFTPQTQSRRSSVEVPAPLKISQSLRQSSVRSFIERSLSTRSSRRNSLSLKPTQHCAIIVQGYGDGLHEPPTSSRLQQNARPVSSTYSELSLLPDGAGPGTSWLRSQTPSAPHSRQISTGSTFARSRTPLLDSLQLDCGHDPLSVVGVGETPTRSDSTSSIASSVFSEGASEASSKSSAWEKHPEPTKISAAEDSGLLGGLVSVGAPVATSRTMSLATIPVPQSQIHMSIRLPSPQEGFDFGFNNAQRELTHAVHESIDVEYMGGATPLSPTLRNSSDLQPIFTAVEARSLIPDERPHLPPRSISVASAPNSIPELSKKRLGSWTSLSSIPPSGYWQRYKPTLTQQKSEPTTDLLEDATPPPILRQRIAFKTPTLQATRPGNEEDRGVKMERRMSNLWLR